jgi:hypothetical protein
MTTNVLYAGNYNGSPLVSIFSNPDGQQGSNIPLSAPTQYLDRIYFDSRFQYFNIVYYGTFTTAYNAIPINSADSTVALKSTSFKTTVIHNFGHAPAAILINNDSREVIGGQTYIQTVNQSYRIAALHMDTEKFYIRERYYVLGDALPAITRRYAIGVFEHPATVPSL